ncbi:unnamed protein product, partial [Owenia fusiformis]
AAASDCAFAFDAIIERFKWEKIGLLVLNSPRMAPVAALFKEEIGKGNITVGAEILFNIDGSSPDVIWETLKDIRIFVAFAPHMGSLGILPLQFLLCKLYKHGFYGRHHVILSYYPTVQEQWDSVHETDFECSRSNMFEVLQGALGCSLSVSTLLGKYDDERHFKTNQTYAELRSIIRPRSNVEVRRYFQPILYDTIWAIALALNATIHDVEYGVNDVKNYKLNEDMTKPLLDSLYGNLLNVNFQGISGHFYYNNTRGFRQFKTYIGLFGSNGELSTSIGYVEVDKKRVVISQSDDIIWKSKGGAAPPDREIKQYQRKRISSAAIFVLSVIAAIGIVLALIYIIYAISHGGHLMIKDEWPIITSVIIVGCILLDVYVLIHVADLETGIHPEPLHVDMCKATTGLLIFGFTFFCGGMTVKLWGVYKFFSQDKTKVIQEAWLMLIFFFLLVADVTLVAVWFVTDPMIANEKEISSTLDDDTSVRTITVMITCESKYKTYFLIATLCYKAIVLLIGGFIVWPALFMSVKKGFVHFSEFVIAVFTSLLVSILLVVISFMIPTEPNALFIINGC